jgi:hypothetical protein
MKSGFFLPKNAKEGGQYENNPFNTIDETGRTYGIFVRLVPNGIDFRAFFGGKSTSRLTSKKTGGIT